MRGTKDMIRRREQTKKRLGLDYWTNNVFTQFLLQKERE